MSELQEKLKLLPTDPGVYVMLDKDGQIIYIGKAKNLRNRVRQYFFNGVKSEKVMAMVRSVADFYYIIAPSEIDALSLENNLIKKHKPRYNILLKDDKTYPYLKVDLKELFPTFKITRKIKKDGCKYFGPYMGGVSVSDVLETINLAFGIRPCDTKFSENKEYKPCLNYHIKKCPAPCAKLISREDYLKLVHKAIDFLSGNTAETERLLVEKMKLAASNEEFEIALKYKENISSLEKIKLKRITSLNKLLNSDVIGYKTNGIYSAVSVLIIRGGRMVGSKNYSFGNSISQEGEALREFVLQYYKVVTEIPEEVITMTEVQDSELLERYFDNVFEKRTTFICAKQGVRKQLLDMASVNAEEQLETNACKIKHKQDMTLTACEKLREVLNLSRYPKRMECYDISNISGVDKVGSMVVFNDGEPDRTSYRRFKIKSFEGADDFRSLKEVLSRRIKEMSVNPEKFPRPDLIIIDGGKGQLSSVKEVFDLLDVKDIDLISLAKREEEIFVTTSNQPIILDKSDYCLRLLQRIRDEAHRFAITYHRSLRSKRSLSSVLDGISGLGKVKKQALLECFKDLSGILNADESQLKKVKGIGEKQAKLIIERLTKEGLI